MHPAILEKRDQLIGACRRYAVSRLDVFGSGARAADFDPRRSDADFLVDFSAQADADTYLELKQTFERILGRPVDLIDRRALQTSRNYIRRRHTLTEAQPFYAA